MNNNEFRLFAAQTANCLHYLNDDGGCDCQPSMNKLNEPREQRMKRNGDKQHEREQKRAEQKRADRKDIGTEAKLENRLFTAAVKAVEQARKR